MKVGFRKTSGVIKPVSEREAELIRKGYTIEQTPNGKIITPPKK